MANGVLFDYGGTLVSTQTDKVILQEILKSRGYEFSTEAISRAVESFRARWNSAYSKLPRGKRWTEAIRIDCERASLQQLGLTTNLDELAAYVARNWSAYARRELYADVTPTLNVLARAGLKLGVVSQYLATSAQLRVELEALGIGKYFQFVLTSEDAGYDKPDSRLYGKASVAIGVHASDLFYVGNDYELDVVGARNAGITPILIDRENRSKQKDCLIVDSLEGVPSILEMPN